MSVNVRPRSSAEPLWLEDADYDALVRRAEGGWSRCSDAREWLAKLHYLREGYKAGKLNAVQFTERETRLVEAWLSRRT